jgi:hypothetical protein
MREKTYLKENESCRGHNGARIISNCYKTLQMMSGFVPLLLNEDTSTEQLWIIGNVMSKSKKN